MLYLNCFYFPCTQSHTPPWNPDIAGLCLCFLFLRAYEESSRVLLAMLQVARKVAKKARNMDFLPIQKDGFVISGGPPNYDLD